MKTTSFRESLVVNVSKEDIKRRILEEPDFIKSHKHGNSLAKFLTRNPKELDDSAIARLLMITEEEVEEIYQKSIDFLKKAMLSSDDED